MEVRRITHVVTAAEAGLRVEQVAQRNWHLSGIQIRRIKWLEDGFLLDGQRVFVNVRVAEGQTLTVRLSDPHVRSDVVAGEGELDIVYEDLDMLVINKAAGVTVHPGPGHWTDSLGNRVMAHYEKNDIMADFHPVHRLDKGTSGLMVVAKHPHSQEQLKNQLHSGDFFRQYWAVCQGHLKPEAGTIDLPIGGVEGSRIERQVRPDGQRSVTHYEVARYVGDLTLVKLTLETGRTHQIRVHLSHLGHPLVGDFLYGEASSVIGRAALHSTYLAITQPITGEKLTFSAPMPADMMALLE